MKVVALIPALSGGQRLPNKNLLLVDGEPMISYVLSALQSSSLNDVFVSTDISEIKSFVAQSFPDVVCVDRYADRGGTACTMNNVSANCGGKRCQVHDHYIYDFLKRFDADIVVQIHTTSPLLKSSTIDKFVEKMIGENLDSCFAVSNHQKECLVNGTPINFSTSQKTPTQDLLPVSELAWAISGWKVSSFIDAYENGLSPSFIGNIGWFPIEKIEAIDVDNFEDLYIAEACLSHRKRKQNVGQQRLTAETISIERELKDLIEKDGCVQSNKKTYNKTLNNINLAKNEMGTGSWCYPVILTDNDQACFIQQVPGEGCRWHNHPTKDEFWIVMEGNFAFEIDGEEPVIASAGDVIYAKKGVNHRITCVGDVPGIRLACGEKNFAHVYEDNEPKKRY